ncbi:hypothetical protein [Escherichia coli]|uniref:hypothetical protein n=1 Tax=Escherichia coli TaxID=562 RepID=UPI00202565AB|nr:hypothetical protein [Escherichia coli]
MKQTKDPHPWHHGRFVCLVTLTRDVYQDILPVISTDKGMKPVDIKNMGFQCVMLTEKMMEEMKKNNAGSLH